MSDENSVQNGAALEPQNEKTTLAARWSARSPVCPAIFAKKSIPASMMAKRARKSSPGSTNCPLLKKSSPQNSPARTSTNRISLTGAVTVTSAGSPKKIMPNPWRKTPYTPPGWPMLPAAASPRRRRGRVRKNPQIPRNAFRKNSRKPGQTRHRRWQPPQRRAKQCPALPRS